MLLGHIIPLKDKGNPNVRKIILQVFSCIMNIIFSERTRKGSSNDHCSFRGVKAGLQLWIHWTCQPLWKNNMCAYMGVSENSGTPKSSIFIRFSIINHPFWGTTIFGNPHIATSHNRQISPKGVLVCFRNGIPSKCSYFRKWRLGEYEQILPRFHLQHVFSFQMGVSKNRGTPKWMVYNGTPY